MRPAATAPDALVDLGGLVAALSLPAEVARAIARSDCPTYRVGRARRYRPAEVGEWLAARSAAAPSGEAPPRPASRALRRRGHIYFIGAREASPVKVGWTVRVEGRIGTLQTGCWEELVCLGSFPGTPLDERAVHAELADRRVRGEWFEREAALAVLRRGIVRCAA